MNGNDWEAIKAHLAETDLRYQQRYDAQMIATATAREGADKAVQAALTAASKQLDEIIQLSPKVEQLSERLTALDRLTDAKFITFRTLVDSQAEKVGLALASADKAVLKAEAATERRFESVNEFRQTLSDQASTFVTRDQFDTLRESQAERVREIAARVDRTEGRTGGLNQGWGYLVGGIGMIVMLVNLGFFVLGH